MSKIEKRLAELSIELPGSNLPVANYIPYLNIDNLAFIAGQTAKWNGELQFAGKLGKEFSVEQGQQAARLCGLNILLQLKSACGGNLDRVKRCVKLCVFVNCTDNFSEHAKVANGVSDLMVEVFGENGRHIRTTTGANSLPSQTAVEVDAVFEIKE